MNKRIAKMLRRNAELGGVPYEDLKKTFMAMSKEDQQKHLNSMRSLDTLVKKKKDSGELELPELPAKPSTKLIMPDPIFEADKMEAFIKGKIDRFKEAKKIPSNMTVKYDPFKDRFAVTMEYKKQEDGTLKPEDNNAKINEALLKKNNLG